MFFSLVTGVALFVSGKARARLEGRNRELEKQITVGQITLQAHEAELQAAHEIQAHFLPHELPQMKHSRLRARGSRRGRYRGSD